jgi:hypothetical protein
MGYPLPTLPIAGGAHPKSHRHSKLVVRLSGCALAVGLVQAIGLQVSEHIITLVILLVTVVVIDLQARLTCIYIISAPLHPLQLLVEAGVDSADTDPSMQLHSLATAVLAHTNATNLPHPLLPHARIPLIPLPPHQVGVVTTVAACLCLVGARLRRHDLVTLACFLWMLCLACEAGILVAHGDW